MSTVTVKISLQDSLLRVIDRAAQGDPQTRSELMREAARAYIQRRERWPRIFAMGRKIAAERNLTPGDVSREIRAHRASWATRK